MFDNPEEPNTIIAADRTRLRKGDRAFNYYDRKPGRITEDPGWDGWFYFEHDDGTKALLNGDRICSTRYAERQGWLP